MTWDDLTAEEREVLVNGVTPRPRPQTTGDWLSRWQDLRIEVYTLYPGADTRWVEEAAWAEVCRRYRRPGVSRG